MYFIALCFMLISVSADNLKCYDCDPNSGQQCINPETENAKATVCADDPLARRTKLKKEIVDIDKLDIAPQVLNNESITFECFSLYQDSNENDYTAGAYRGCIEKTDTILTSCEYLIERLNINVTSCETCSTNLCNRQYIGSSSSLRVSILIMLFNLFIVLNVFAV